MRIKGILLRLATAWLFFGEAASAQGTPACGTPENKPALVHSIGVNAGADYVASSYNDEILEAISSKDKIKGNSAIPLNLRYSFSFTNPGIPHYMAGGYQGAAVCVLNIGALQPHGISNSTRNIGYPVLAYIFQGGPVCRFGERLSLNYEWNFGAAFGWKPYTDTNKTYNLIVGSRVNAYLNLGLYLGWRLTPEIDLLGGVCGTHFSNGNTSFPNPGVNSFGVRVGIRYTLNPLSKGFPAAVPDTIQRSRMVDFDISAWGATRKRVYRGGEKPVLMKGHYACAGISFAPMYRFNSNWKLGGSLDLQWDQSSDMKRNHISGSTTDDLEFSTPDFWRQVTLGVSAHGELRMPIFAVNVGCGYNLVAPWENRGTYQNITLKIYPLEKFFVNIGYQLRNFKQQSSLMLGAGVTI